MNQQTVQLPTTLETKKKEFQFTKFFTIKPKTDAFAKKKKTKLVLLKKL